MVTKNGSAGLFSLLCMSTAQILFTPARMEELLTQSRRNTARDEVTGLLIFRDGTFMQLLEGTREVIETRFRKIKADERHYAVVTLFEGPITERYFPTWSMDYRNLRDPEVRKLQALKDFDTEAFNSGEFATDPSLAVHLLKIFQGVK